MSQSFLHGLSTVAWGDARDLIIRRTGDRPFRLVEQDLHLLQAGGIPLAH
jgi:hypothetical protein